MEEYSSSIWTGPVLNNDNDLRQSRDVRDAPIAYLVRSAGPKNCSNPVLNSRDNLLWGDALPHGSSSICVLWIVSWELGLDCEAGREAYLPLFQWVQEVSIARTCGSKSFAEREDRGDARHLWLKLGDCNVNLLRIPGRRDRSPASRDQVGEEPPRCRCPCQHLPQRRQQVIWLN